MWKFAGYAWKLNHLKGVYSTRCTLRERVVRPIDQLRSDIVLALSLVAMIDPRMATLRWESIPNADMHCSCPESSVVWR
jgi:hypothetical protein